MELQQFLAILSPDAEWICLQKEIREKDFAMLRQFGRIAFFGDDLRDFSDTAALLDLMDLVITIDTGVAHLAGAMGKPVWILLPYNGCWIGMIARGTRAQGCSGSSRSETGDGHRSGEKRTSVCDPLR
jgi:hypothetical protein